MPSTKKPAFEVDREGLAKLLARRGPAFAVSELVSNAWDEDTTRVDITLRPHDDGHYRLTVTDDNPDGFKDLSHAYTLFAESAKKGSVTKRGRFNLGEKLVIAVCRDATLRTTTGTIRWEGEFRHHTKAGTDAGSMFEGVLPMTDAEAQEVERLVHSLLPPFGITTVYNGTTIEPRDALRTFGGSLRTETVDSEGRLKPTTRRTDIAIYDVRDGETAHLYELGIPVVATGDRYHVDIAQKVPVNLDRDNVPPAYLRDIRSLVLNAAADLIVAGGGATDRWVNDALEDERTDPDAVRQIITARYGDRVVTADPSDREAEKRAVQEGFTLIPAGAFSRSAWNAVKGTGIVLPAGQVTPSPNPDDGELTGKVMLPEHQPENVAAVVGYAQAAARAVLDIDISVRIVNAPQWGFNGTWQNRGSRAELTINFGKLGYGWFEVGSEGVDALLIHEFAHRKVSDHFTRHFYDECCKMGARLLKVQRTTPDALGVTEAVTA